MAGDAQLQEDLEKIPMLSREDLSREIKPFVNRVEDGCHAAMAEKALETPVIAHPLNTSGIDYLTFMFDISKLPQKFFPYLGIFKTLLGVLDTENFSYAELDQEINIYTGGIGATVSVYTQNGGSVKIQNDGRSQLQGPARQSGSTPSGW